MAEPAVCDAICVANQIGRLDLVSVLLATLGILLALGGVFAFLNVRSSSRSIAKEVATETAKHVAEAHAVAYLERELPNLISAYQELARNAVPDDQANAIANAQEDGGKK